MTRLTIITDTKALTNEIKAIGAASTKLQDRIQIAALSAMANHAEFGQVALLNLLVAKMGNGSRVKALIEFIDHWSKADYDAENKTFVHNKKGTFDLDAVTGHWVDFVKASESSNEFNLAAEMAKLVKRLEKAAKNDNVNVVASKEQLEAFAAAVNTK